MSSYLTDEQNLQVLKNLLNLAERVNEIKGFDDTTIGDKKTWVNVGMCNDHLEIYPDRDMHIFPDQFPERSSPKHRDKFLSDKHICPLSFEKKSWGCFYSCWYFQRGLKDIEKVRRAIRNRIKWLEARSNDISIHG